jgi:hypothetical protein
LAQRLHEFGSWKEGANHVRKSLSLVLFFGLPVLAQVQGGHETVQDAVRFERQKDAAAARQARIESRRAANSTADREADDMNKGTKSAKAHKGKTGSAARSDNSEQPKK